MTIEPLTEHEAIERHMMLVHYDKLGVKLNNISEQHVYHYTRLKGLRGIAENGRIWATDYRFLNDASELHFGLDILEMVIAHQEPTPSMDNERRRKILLETARLRQSEIGLHVFVFHSASKETFAYSLVKLDRCSRFWLAGFVRSRHLSSTLLSLRKQNGGAFVLELVAISDS
jgi:hypothetical protein